MHTLITYFKVLVVTAAITLVGAGLFVFSGLYPMGADVPHNKLTYWLLETLRERSIARAASDIEVPADLNSSQRLLMGGADYNDMCVGCHLKPGKNQTDFTLGLYPVPPNLTLKSEDHGHGESGHKNSAEQVSNYSVQRQFWIIKHGIKASGMPAWAPGHDDDRIWNMVAFLQRLPELSASQYQIITARDEADHSSHH